MTTRHRRRCSFRCCQQGHVMHQVPTVARSIPMVCLHMFINMSNSSVIEVTTKSNTNDETHGQKRTVEMHSGPQGIANASPDTDRIAATAKSNWNGRFCHSVSLLDTHCLQLAVVRHIYTQMHVDRRTRTAHRHPTEQTYYQHSRNDRNGHQRSMPVTRSATEHQMARDCHEQDTQTQIIIICALASQAPAAEPRLTQGTGGSYPWAAERQDEEQCQRCLSKCPSCTIGGIKPAGFVLSRTLRPQQDASIAIDIYFDGNVVTTSQHAHAADHSTHHELSYMCSFTCLQLVVWMLRNRQHLVVHVLTPQRHMHQHIAPYNGSGDTHHVAYRGLHSSHYLCQSHRRLEPPYIEHLRTFVVRKVLRVPQQKQQQRQQQQRRPQPWLCAVMFWWRRYTSTQERRRIGYSFHRILTYSCRSVGSTCRYSQHKAVDAETIPDSFLEEPDAEPHRQERHDVSGKPEGVPCYRMRMLYCCSSSSKHYVWRGTWSTFTDGG